jgi:hypothetical protein
MKLFAITIGYKIVKLGYDALVQGIKGEFDFGGKVVSKIEFKLLSASPGLFFVLFGSAIIIWAIAVDKPVAFNAEFPAVAVSPTKPQPETAVQPEPAASTK